MDNIKPDGMEYQAKLNEKYIGICTCFTLHWLIPETIQMGLRMYCFEKDPWNF